MFPKVQILYQIIKFAKSRLPEEKFLRFLSRLENPQKHNDVLAEFAPVLHIDGEVRLEYEKTGYSEGTKDVDWILQDEKLIIALEVKSRFIDLCEHLNRINKGERDPHNIAPEPSHDVSLIFKSIEPKFISRSPTEVINAAWIFVRVKQKEDKLIQAYSRLDQTRVHVIILGDWDDGVYILSNNDHAKRVIVNTLKLRESNRFVF